MTAAGSLAAVSAAGGLLGYRLADCHADVIGALSLATMLLCLIWLLSEWAAGPERPHFVPHVHRGWVCLACLAYFVAVELGEVPLCWKGITPTGAAHLFSWLYPYLLPAAYFAEYGSWRGFAAVVLFVFMTTALWVWNGTGENGVCYLVRIRWSG